MKSPTILPAGGLRGKRIADSIAAMRRSPVLRVPLLATLVLLAGEGALAAQSPAADFLDARQLAEEGRVETALVLLDRVVAAVPDDPYVRLERSELLLRVGRIDEASREIAAALHLAPDNLDGVRLQGRVELLRTERDPAAFEVAQAAFEKLREHDPEDLEALISLGQIYLGSGRPGLAADALAEADRLRPRHPGIQQLLQRALEASDDPAVSARILGERLARDPQSLATRLELADLQARAGDPAAALSVLAGASEAQRDGLDVRRRMALLRFQVGDLEAARGEAAAIVERWPNYSGGRVLLARIEVAQGRFAEAETLLGPLFGGEAPPVVFELELRILEATGRTEEAAARLAEEAGRLAAEGSLAAAAVRRFERAQLWARAGNWSEALAATEEARSGGAADLADDTAALAAEALEKLGRTDEALARLGPPDPARPRLAALRVGLLLDAGREAEAEREARGLEGQGGEALVALGAVYAARADWPASIAVLERAVASAPDDLEGAFRLATALERGGRYGEAVERFRSILAAVPDFAPALNYLGYLWIERGEQIEEALAMVDRAVRIDPDNGAYVDSLGWGFFRLGRFTEAVAALERAVRLLPDDATVRFHLGDALLAAGARERAVEAYREATRLGGPDGDAAARKLVELEGGL